MMSWGLGGILMILFWFGFVWLIVWIVREVSGNKTNQDSKALAILKERYAKGEISKKEFEAKKRDLID